MSIKTYVLNTLCLLSFCNLSYSQNYAPIAVNDTVKCLTGQSVEVNVLLNDYDPDGDTIMIMGQSYEDSTRIVSIPIIWSNPSGYANFGYLIWDQFGNFSSDSSKAYIVVKVINKSSAWLDVNNVRASINAFGKLFNSSIEDGGEYYVPANQKTRGFYESRLWLTGIDDSNNVHASAEYQFTYGDDYWAGPVADTFDLGYEQRWYKIWNLTKDDIEYHKTNWNDPGYEPIPDIASWPGNGDESNGEAAQLAPFIDMNTNGIYEPQFGDYPKIKGDQCLFYIINDVYAHDATSARSFGAEIHTMAYAFDCEEDSAFHNTMFLNYRIYNRSDTTYHDCYFGLYSSWRLGEHWDNFIGCDTLLHSYYCYNGDNYDESSFLTYDTIWGYEEFPPALSVSFLNKSMTNFIGVNDIWPLGPPYSAYHYHNLQKGILKDSTHMTYGSGGWWGAVPTNYMFSGDPLDTLSGWTELTAGRTPSWQQGIGSHGPFEFNPGDGISFDFAFVFGRDYEGNYLTSINTMKERIETIRYYFEQDSIPCGGSFQLSEQAYTMNTPPLLYPNPVKDQLFIKDFQRNGMVNVQIYDILGRCVLNEDYNTNFIKIQLGNLNPGLYSVRLNNQNQVFTQKIIKQ